tara:strand:- start:549 stop:695 length:147 start_codon:yes stop_codon:yes gene_type:complete
MLGLFTKLGAMIAQFFDEMADLGRSLPLFPKFRMISLRMVLRPKWWAG